MRARWRSDQFLDLGFNVAIGLVVIALIGGILLLVNRSGVASVSNDAIDFLATRFVSLARRVTPVLPVYAGAAAVLGSVLGIWWWAERDVTL